MATLLDGKAIAARIREQVRSDVRALVEAGRPVKLVTIMVGQSDAGLTYSKSQARRCKDVGIEYELQTLPDSATLVEVYAAIDALNANPAVTGIMLNLPFPEHVDSTAAQYRIDPFKDVEGVNPSNIGFVFYGRPIIAPCTAQSILEVLEAAHGSLVGQDVVVVGQGAIVGRPITLFLLQEQATVTACHKATRDLAAHTRQADVLIVAVGCPGLITGDMVKPGAVVIDVGINHVPGPDGTDKIVGDVDAASVGPVAATLTPVPGGIGPITVAILLRNTVEAARKQLDAPAS